jgi:hypothetical protein
MCAIVLAGGDENCSDSCAIYDDRGKVGVSGGEMSSRLGQ